MTNFETSYHVFGTFLKYWLIEVKMGDASDLDLYKATANDFRALKQ